MPDPNLGRVLDNRYELVEPIGQGSMGHVYRARHILLGGSVAVKFLSQALLSEKNRDRFYTEARTCAQLGQKSIYIVQVMDFGVDEHNIPFYVMEYLQGEVLKGMISGRPLDLPKFLRFAKQICLGLQCAHEGIMIGGKPCPIIHRDIKPSNILISHNPSLGDLAKILDFGIAKLTLEDVERTRRFMGTLAYASPEQMDGRELDPRSDLYSLGVMMFQMLTGQIPLLPESPTFQGWYQAHQLQLPRTFASVNPALQLPSRLEELIVSCLAKRPSSRPQNAGKILQTLEAIERELTRTGQPEDQPTLPPEQEIPSVTEVQDGGTAIPSSWSGLGLFSNQIPVELFPADLACQQQVWPADKPIAEIVFAHALCTNELELATLWVMVAQENLEKIKLGKLYNRIYHTFLCTVSPHPMILWVTAIYNRLYDQKRGPRWLIAFLDLKAAQGQSLTRILCQQEHYRILFFAKEKPEACAHVIQVTLNPTQRELLERWTTAAIGQVSSASPNVSKTLLRREFEQLKPKIHSELTA